MHCLWMNVRQLEVYLMQTQKSETMGIINRLLAVSTCNIFSIAMFQILL